MINGISNVNRSVAFRAENKNTHASQPEKIITTQPQEKLDIKKKDTGLVKWLVGAGVVATAVAAYFLTRGKGGGEVADALSKKGSEVVEDVTQVTANVSEKSKEIAQVVGEKAAEVTEKVKTVTEDVGQKVSETAEKVTTKVKRAVQDAKEKVETIIEEQKTKPRKSCRKDDMTAESKAPSTKKEKAEQNSQVKLKTKKAEEPKKDAFDVLEESFQTAKKESEKVNKGQPQLLDGTDDFLTAAIIADDLCVNGGGKKSTSFFEKALDSTSGKIADDVITEPAGKVTNILDSDVFNSDNILGNPLDYTKLSDDISSVSTLDFDIPDLSRVDDFTDIGGGVGDILDGLGDIF